MNLKLHFTQRALENINDSSILLNQALTTWWHNLRPNGGLRLTDQGFKIFADILKLEQYQYQFPTDRYIDINLLLNLDRKLKCPYYINKRKSQIVFFGSKEAVLNSLYGDLKTFIQQYDYR